MGEKVISEILRDYIHNSLEEGKRIDGRGYDDYRPITIETNVIESAEGSARVHIGNTDVLAGIKMTVGAPFPDTPNVGVMTTNAELIPMASPNFESGPPDPKAIELSRVVDRGLREGHAVDMEKLVIKEGELVWIMFIDVHILDYDGNLFDASALAAMAALGSATVPASQFADQYPDYDLGDDFPMPINNYPIMTTFVKIKDIILADPGLDEEKVADARLSVSTDPDGRVRAMQKGLNGSFSYAEIQDIVRKATEKGNELRDILKKSL